VKYGTEGKCNLPPNVDSPKNSRFLALGGFGHDRWDVLEGRGATSDQAIGTDTCPTFESHRFFKLLVAFIRTLSIV
jgi:hypothetical protein